MSERQRVMPADNPMPSSTPAAPTPPPPSLTTTPTQPRTPAPTPTPVVTTPHRMGMEDPAVAHDAPHADHHAAPADVSINAVVGEKVILNGSVYDMGDLPSPQYGWTLVSPPEVTAFLTSPDKVSPSFVAEVPGDYVASMHTPYGPAKVTIHVVEKPKA